MYQIKIQVDNGEVISVETAKIIIENTGLDEDEQVHINATPEGIIVDVVKDGEIIDTASCYPEDILPGKKS